jgi:hypothetical protein
VRRVRHDAAGALRSTADEHLAELIGKWYVATLITEAVPRLAATVTRAAESPARDPGARKTPIALRRPVQPLRLSYHHVDGSVSTAPAYVGEDTLLRSVCRLLRVRRTVACLRVESLQLPGKDRRALASRRQLAVREVTPAVKPHPGYGHVGQPDLAFHHW